MLQTADKILFTEAISQAKRQLLMSVEIVFRVVPLIAEVGRVHVRTAVRSVLCFVLAPDFAMQIKTYRYVALCELVNFNLQTAHSPGIKLTWQLFLKKIEFYV